MSIIPGNNAAFFSKRTASYTKDGMVDVEREANGVGRASQRGRVSGRGGAVFQYFTAPYNNS